MHDDIYDHDHPDNFVIKEDEIVTDIEGLEMFSLKSVGIDIGSSTSHLIFSQITLRREGASLSGRFKVTNREVLYRSPIMLTNCRSPNTVIRLPYWSPLTALNNPTCASIGHDRRPTRPSLASRNAAPDSLLIT